MFIISSDMFRKKNSLKKSTQTELQTRYRQKKVHARTIISGSGSPGSGRRKSHNAPYLGQQWQTQIEPGERRFWQVFYIPTTREAPRTSFSSSGPEVPSWPQEREGRTGGRESRISRLRSFKGNHWTPNVETQQEEATQQSRTLWYSDSSPT